MTPNELQQLADKLPEGVAWGAPLAPEIAQHLAQAPSLKPVRLSDDEIATAWNVAHGRMLDKPGAYDLDEFDSEFANAIMDAMQAKDAGPMVSRIEELEALLLWSLYHHQGGSSGVGLPIRCALGIGQHEPLTKEQIAKAKEALVKWEGK